MRLLFVLLGISCAPVSVRTVAPVNSAPVEVHADVTFSEAERTLLSDAALDLAAQTGLTIRLRWDLDFGLPRTLRAKPQLVRVTSSADRVGMLDRRFGSRVLGFTMWSERRAELVVDRLTDPLRFKTASAHELGHLVGVDDVKGGQLMGECMAREPATVLNDDDFAAFAATGR